MIRTRGGRPRACIVRQTDLYEYPLRREAETLRDAGYDVEVVLMRSRERPRRTVIDGVDLTSLPAQLRRGGTLAYAADYARFLLLAGGLLAYRHLRRPYAVVQVNTMPDFLVFAALVPKLLGSKVIAYMKEPTPELAQTLYRSRWLPRVLAWVEQRAIRFADHALTVTDDLRQVYIRRGAPPEKLSVVRNGADARTMRFDERRAQGARGAGFQVVCHGTIEERYGHGTLLEAVGLLRDELPDLRLVIVGRGSWSDEVVRRIAAAGLEDVVRFEGWVTLERLHEVLLASHAGVVAQEASPYSHLVHTNKMVDYWLFGVPVVASRLRATASAYDDAVLEYFEPGDAASLAAAIRRLHDDPGRRAELIANGREALRLNGWGAQREAYLAVYASLLARNGSPDAAERRPAA